MTTDINPCIVDGEPTCSGEECPALCVYRMSSSYFPCIPGLRRLLAEARGALRLAESAIADECNDGCESEEDRAAGCVFDAPEPCAVGVALRAVRTVLYAPAPSGADGGEGEGK
jgi:hypothetical protein